MVSYLPDAAVWFEISATDMETPKRFYGVGPQNELAEADGASSSRARLPTAVMGRAAANDGSVVSPVFPVSAGGFVYCLHPDGNSPELVT